MPAQEVTKTVATVLISGVIGAGGTLYGVNNTMYAVKTDVALLKSEQHHIKEDVTKMDKKLDEILKELRGE